MLDFRLIDQLIDLAFTEDLGGGDITTESTVSIDRQATAIVLAKTPGVIAGQPIADRVFQKIDPQLRYAELIADGTFVEAKTQIAEINGSAKSILIAERTALNFLQRLSGIATITAEFVRAVSHTKAQIIDTRKTTAGWRSLQKYAVRIGGGRNHRFGLFDGVMIKDNHIVAAGGITNAVRKAKNFVPHTIKIEVEAKTLDQVREAIDAKADIILLDNMSDQMMREAVAIIDGKAITEASGGITLDCVETVAVTGVSLISVGALTHSAPPLDISLDLQI